MTYKHPCFHHNRHPFPDTVTVQDGWTDDGRRNMVTRPNPMSKECQQWGEYGWARIQRWDCIGCRWYPENVEAS